jgi:hypothetical protein
LIYRILVTIGKHVIFPWIARYIGIRSNIVLYHEAAKDTIDNPISNSFTPYFDFIMKYILKTRARQLGPAN